MPDTAEELRFRQVHLDFHTSEAIAGVGAAFDPEEFAATLERARVNSVNIFARCHHGWMYYDTRRFPERRHPSLKRNLLGEQIEALHRRDIRCPLYVTVQWDKFTADRHPEWLVLGPDGRPLGPGPYDAGFYRPLCVNSPYSDFLREHVRELLEMFEVDGFWFDILIRQDCSCSRCREAMRRDGVNVTDAQARIRWYLGFLARWKREMTAFVHAIRPRALLYYNKGDLGPHDRPEMDAYTHWEQESLPSGSWGYLHFPGKIRYARTLKRETLGMTGKFHTSWGDFHSFKNPAALQFECFRMLALGAKCCVGDQLHPTGRICPHTYRLIGDVFRVVEAVEPWCHGAAPLAEVGVLSPEEFAPIALSINQPPAFKGAVRMLDELAVAFDVLDSAADFSRYRALVLPDEVPLAPPLARKLARYLRAGGAVLATHKAGLTPAGDRFALPAFGVRRVGDAPFSPDFIVPRGPLAAGLPPTEHVLYQRGLEVRPARGATVLARVNVPYFNRTGEHFCSHRHTPSAGRADYPAAVRHGRVVYFAHPLFGQYAANAPLWCKRLVANALGLLMPNPLLRSNAPSAAMLTLNAQPAANRWVLHVLHYVPERRGQDFDTIEDVVPLHNVRVSVRDDLGIRSARLAPDGRALRFRRKDGRVEFTIPEVNGYQVVALEGGGNGAVSRRAHRPRTR